MSEAPNLLRGFAICVEVTTQFIFWISYFSIICCSKAILILDNLLSRIGQRDSIASCGFLLSVLHSIAGNGCSFLSLCNISFNRLVIVCYLCCILLLVMGAFFQQVSYLITGFSTFNLNKSLWSHRSNYTFYNFLGCQDIGEYSPISFN